MKEQVLKKFSVEEEKTWAKLFENLEETRNIRAHEIFNDGLKKLGFTKDSIPNLNEINKNLMEKTGWQGVAVEGLEDGQSFFNGLADKKFPIGNFIRDPKDLSYTPAPDIFHDLYGHIPFLADEDYANFCHEFGKRSLKYLDDEEKLRMFERLFWFTVEFGLIKTDKGPRIFGGGILSSAGESEYSLSDGPEVIAFDVKKIAMQEFRIDIYQEKLFILDNKEQLYQCLDEFEEVLAAI